MHSLVNYKQIKAVRCRVLFALWLLLSTPTDLSRVHLLLRALLVISFNQVFLTLSLTLLVECRHSILVLYTHRRDVVKGHVLAARAFISICVPVASDYELNYFAHIRILSLISATNFLTRSPNLMKSLSSDICLVGSHNAALVLIPK